MILIGVLAVVALNFVDNGVPVTVLEKMHVTGQPLSGINILTLCFDLNDERWHHWSRLPKDNEGSRASSFYPDHADYIICIRREIVELLLVGPRLLTKQRIRH
jgi:hypothetical protein